MDFQAIESFLKNLIVTGKNGVVVFSATVCPPCDSLKVKLNYIAHLYKNEVEFAYIDISQNRELFKKYNIKGIPALLFFNKEGMLIKTVESQKIADLSRNSLIDLLVECYTLNKADMAKRELKYDVVVIGAGPAGLAATIYCSEAGLKTALIEKKSPGGQVSWTHIVSNYPGTSKPILGEMLSLNMLSQAKSARVDFFNSSLITQIDLSKKVVEIENCDILKSKVIIVATGAYPTLLGVPGEKKYLGKGISFCAVCDANLYAGKTVAVFGGGKSAAEESLYLSKIVKKVILISDLDKLTATHDIKEKLLAKENVKIIYSSSIKSFNGDTDKIEAVTIFQKDKSFAKQIKCDGVFLFTPKKPSTEFIKSQIALDEYGFIKTDELMHTNTEGVFACGDARKKKYCQITVATSEGTIAALEAIEYIETTQ